MIQSAAFAVTLERADAGFTLRSPRVGSFRPAVSNGSLVGPGTLVGHLVILGRWFPLVAHGKTRGVVRDTPTRGAVEYGAPLVTLSDLGDASEDEERAIPEAETGTAIRSPYPGRFYSRPSPDAPPFTSAGEKLENGQTVGLLEVMKTFNRISYTGPGSTVDRVLVQDGEDVALNQALIALRDA